jgi:hypothetical protein
MSWEISVILPSTRSECSRDSLQQKNQPIEKLDEVIKEIRKLMLESTEEMVSKRKLDEMKPT